MKVNLAITYNGKEYYLSVYDENLCIISEMCVEDIKISKLFIRCSIDDNIVGWINLKNISDLRYEGDKITLEKLKEITNETN